MNINSIKMQNYLLQFLQNAGGFGNAGNIGSLGVSDTGRIGSAGRTEDIRGIGNVGSAGRIGHKVEVAAPFDVALREQRISGIKAEIYEKFQIDVGAAEGKLVCQIPEDVLYRMNSDGVLKKKVYQTLADYSSDTTQRVMDSLFPPVKKVTLIFDEKGDNAAALETDMDQLEKSLGYSAGQRSGVGYGGAGLMGLLFQKSIPGLYGGSGVYPYGGYPNNMWTQYGGMAASFAAPEKSGTERHKWRFR